MYVVVYTVHMISQNIDGGTTEGKYGILGNGKQKRELRTFCNFIYNQAYCFEIALILPCFEILSSSVSLEQPF